MYDILACLWDKELKMPAETEKSYISPNLKHLGMCIPHEWKLGKTYLHPGFVKALQERNCMDTVVTWRARQAQVLEHIYRIF